MSITQISRKNKSGVEITPQTIEAERALVGTLLFAKYAEELQNYLEQISLSEQDFFDTRNGTLFTIIKNLAENNILPDVITIDNYIKENDLQQKISVIYVMELQNSIEIPIFANLTKYAEKIRETALQRKIWEQEKYLRLLIQQQADIKEVQKTAKKIEELTEELEIGKSKEKIHTFAFNPTLANVKAEMYCGLFPEGFVSLLAGRAGTGKTYTAIRFATDFVVETGKKAFLWLSEDAGQIHFRVAQVIRTYPAEKKEEIKKILQEKIILTDDIALPFLEKNYGKIEVVEENIQAFVNVTKDASLIFLDPLIAFVGVEDENGNGAARHFMRDALLPIVRNKEKAIVLIHHVSKATQNEKETDIQELVNYIRGASDYVGAARSVCYLRRKEEKAEVIVVKSNVGKTGVVKILPLPTFSDTKMENIENTNSIPF